MVSISAMQSGALSSGTARRLALRTRGGGVRSALLVLLRHSSRRARAAERAASRSGDSPTTERSADQTAAESRFLNNGADLQTPRSAGKIIATAGAQLRGACGGLAGKRAWRGGGGAFAAARFLSIRRRRNLDSALSLADSVVAAVLSGAGQVTTTRCACACGEPRLRSSAAARCSAGGGTRCADAAASRARSLLLLSPPPAPEAPPPAGAARRHGLLLLREPRGATARPAGLGPRRAAGPCCCVLAGRRAQPAAATHPWAAAACCCCCRCCRGFAQAGRCAAVSCCELLLLPPSS